MKCYRVWFMDGSATLVDAANESDARRECSMRGYSTAIARVECLSR